MKLALIGTGKIIEDALFAMEPVETIERTAIFARPHSRDKAVYYIKKISIAAEVVLIATCLLMFGLTYPITYFGGMEPESAKLCIFMVTCITIVKPIVWIMAFIPPYGFRAAGDVRFTMTTSMLCMWFCRVVLAMVLARVFHMGPIAVWIGMFTDWTIRGIIYTIRFKNRKWHLSKFI
jgi:Na+-driven multidrug efflux pump